MIVELWEITDDERAELRKMAERYWMDLMPTAPVVQDPARRAAYFESHFQLGTLDSAHWWAVVEGTKIGFAKVDLGEDHDGRWARIRDFYIEVAWRHQGHGKSFAQAIVERLREQGTYRVDLNVRQDNPGALAFWRTLGFEVALYHLRMYLD